MDTGFPYSTMPNPRGGFTTRPVLAAQTSAAGLEAAVAAATGLPPEQCGRVFTAYLRELLAAAGRGGWSQGLYGLVRFGPVSGGSQPDPQDFLTADDLKAGAALAFTAPAIRQWRRGLRLASQGATGKITPLAATVLCGSTGLPDEYVPGGFITLRGQRLKLDPGDPQQGIFLIQEDGAEARCEHYARLTRLQATTVAPESLSGPLRLRVAVKLNGSVRSVVYGAVLRETTRPLLVPGGQQRRRRR